MDYGFGNFTPDLSQILANLPPEVLAQIAAETGQQYTAPAPVAQPVYTPEPAYAPGPLSLGAMGDLDFSRLDLSDIDVGAIPPSEPVYTPEPAPAPLAATATPEPAYVPGFTPALANAPFAPNLAQIMANLPPEVAAQVEAAVGAAPLPEPVAAPAPVLPAPEPVAAAPLAAAAEPTPSYVPGFTPSLERAGRFAGEGADVQLDASGGVPALSSVATTPNYLVRPTADLDPLTLALQEIDGQRGFQFVTNKGNAAGVAGKMASTKGAAGIENPTGFVPLVEGATYRIRNEKGQDQIVYSGTGEEGLRNVYALAQDLSAERGKKANWGVEMQLPGETSWRRVADDDPAKSLISKVGKVVGTALPLATLAIPGLNVLGTIAASTALGGAGAALAGRDPLKGAVMGGLGAAGGSVLGPALGKGLDIGSKAAGAIGTGIGTTAGGLATGQNLQNALLGGVTSGALSYLGGELQSALKGTPTPGATSDAGVSGGTGGGGSYGGDIVVTGSLAPILNTGPLANLLTSSDIARQVGQRDVPGYEPITVEAQRPLPTSITGQGALANLGNVTPDVIARDAAATRPQDEIVVEAPRDLPPSITGQGPLTNVLTPDQIAKQVPEADVPGNKSTLDKLSDTADYLKLASLALGLLGGGGGGSTAKARIPAGLGGAGSLGGVFTSQLPGPSMPGLTGGTGGARTAADLAGRGLSSNIDYYRYGYGPEQSFFSNVPQGARNTSTAYTGYAEGGEVSDDDDYRIARRRLEAEREYEGDRQRMRRKPRFSSQHSFGGDDFSSYSMGLPVGEGELSVDAFGRGLRPEMFAVGMQQPLGRANLRASHMIGGGSDYGVSLPIMDGMLDISAQAPRGFRPRGVRASYRKQFEEGGYAVGGPGDGRDDKIPALLSDGEYVIDAETVALLGNGSTKAGADALDNFRVSIRKHKGRKMAKGDFSAKAKKPEQYLKKGRA